jgi:cytochrome c peroxidase
MNYKTIVAAATLAAVLGGQAGLVPSVQAGPGALSAMERLGRQIFFDRHLSLRRNQACASCHVPEAGWVGDDPRINEAGAVYEGSVHGAFGNRKPPSSAYATFAPVFCADDSADPDNPVFVGGNFWDGRATGWTLGSPAADQAQGPFLNPVEQALPDAACVVYRVCEGRYGRLFRQVWGGDSCAIDWGRRGAVNRACAAPDGVVDLGPTDREAVSQAFDRIALSVAAFEASSVSNAFTSKIDARRAGLYTFTEQEELGRQVFRGKGLCVACHLGTPGPDAPPPLFTDFGYHNLGVPKNPLSPFLAANPDWADPGLAGFLETVADYAHFAPDNLGKHKTPTLRNVGLGSCEAREYDEADTRPRGPCITKAYMHNGYFKTLKQVVHFYNTRDIKPVCEDLGILDATVEVALANECWPQPEVAANVDETALGNLGLSPAEEEALVAFMMAMSDGYLTDD